MISFSATLLPWECGFCLHWPCGGYYWPLKHICHFATTHTTAWQLNAKPLLMLHIIGGIELLFHPFVCWSKGTMFTSSDFGVAQSRSIGLHCSMSFGGVGWQSWNVPLENMGFNLQHRCGMCHNMLYKFRQVLYTCSFSLVIGRKMEWFTLLDWCELQLALVGRWVMVW